MNSLKSLIIILLVGFLNIFSLSGQNREFKICFDFNSSSLNSNFENDIKEIAKIVKSDNYSFIKIFGYASTSGDFSYNMKLSKNRAYTVFNKLNQLNKIDATRFYMTWIGESSNVYDLHYKNAHSQSKCVDIVIQGIKK